MTHSTQGSPSLNYTCPEVRLLALGLFLALGYHKGPISTSEVSSLTILTIIGNFPLKRQPNHHDLFKQKNGCVPPFESG